MPRYFFDIHEEQSIRLDDLGTVLSDAKAAEQEAIRSLAAMIPHRLTSGEDFKTAIEVREASRPVTRIVVKTKIHRF